jgi:hypothetical protein
VVQFLTSSQNLGYCSLVRPFRPAASCRAMGLPVIGEITLSEVVVVTPGMMKLLHGGCGCGGRSRGETG